MSAIAQGERMPTDERMLLSYIADCRVTAPTAERCVGTGKVLPATPAGVAELASRLCDAGLLATQGEPITYEATEAGRAALARERRRAR